MNPSFLRQPATDFNDDRDDADHPGVKPLSVVIRRAAERIPRPLPTALVMLQAAGVNVDGDAR